MWRFAVEYLRDLPYPCFGDMSFEAGQKFSDPTCTLRKNAPVSVDESSDQPSPDGALVVGGIAIERRTYIYWDIFGVVR